LFLNSLIVVSIFLVDLSWYCHIDYLWNIFNLSPFNSVVEYKQVNFSESSNVLDSVRRVTIPIFFYLIASSALRFKFKK
jgi:hypothetical protein